MARLRFPGRPGHRFGRLGVRYGTDETQKDEDPTTRLIANIHRGLRVFREIFGESDEEEFPGFSTSEVAQVEQKLEELNSDLLQLQDDSSKPQTTRKVVHVEDTTGKGRFSQRSRLKDQAKKAVASLVDEGHAQHLKPSTVKKIRDAKAKSLEAERASPLKLNRIKIRLRDGGKAGEIVKESPTREFEKIPGKKMKVQIGMFKKKSRAGNSQTSNASADDEGSEEEVTPKKRQKNIAKQILDKAKKGQGKVAVKSVKGGLTKSQRDGKITKAKDKLLPKQSGKPPPSTELTSPSKIVRKQFIIPVKSARSSRQIKPNKRFYDTDTAYSTVVPHASPPPVEFAEPPQHPELPGISHPVEGLAQLSDDSRKHRLLEGPLIVEGKRERKPSMKLIRKLTDEIDTKSLAARETEKVEKVLMRDKSGRLKHSVKRSGKVILQKAKLCLNQAAINRSKAALVKTLQVQMKKDEQAKKSSRKKAPKESDSSDQSSPEQEQRSRGKGVKFLPLGGTGFKPLSPIKFSSLSRETAVFGLSSLPAVPKFALESTTASLPTFQSTHQQGPSSSPDEASGEPAEPQADQEPTRQHRECIICELPNIFKHGIGNENAACANCKRFYARRTLRLLMSNEPYVCEKGGECQVHHSLSGRMCIACRYLKCKKNLIAAERLAPVARYLKDKGLKRVPRLSVIIRQPGEEEAKKKEKTPKKPKEEKEKTPKRKEEPQEQVIEEPTPIGKPPEKLEVMSRTAFWAWSKSLKSNLSAAKLLGKGAYWRHVGTKLRHGPGKTAMGRRSSKKEMSPNLTSSLMLPSVIEGTDFDAQLLEMLNPPAPKRPTPSIPYSTPLTIDTGNDDEMDESELVPEDIEEDAAEGQVRIGGPRIKHVCRRAAVALGEPACFPSHRELTLSALPTLEKERILRLEEQRAGSPDSDDMSLDEIIRQARDDREDVITIKRTPNKAFHPLVPKGHRVQKAPKPTTVKSYKRTMRCKACEGCKAECCGKCINCRDMPKFGGRGVTKKACIHRVCQNPVRPKPLQEDPSYSPISPNLIAYAPVVEQPRTTTERQRTTSNSTDRQRTTSERLQTRSSSYVPSESRNTSLRSAETGLTVTLRERREPRLTAEQTRVPSPPRSDRSDQTITVNDHRLEHRKGRFMTKFNVMEKKGKNRLQSLPEGALRPRKKWPSFSQDNHFIKGDFKESFDVLTAWSRGLALVSSLPICLRTVCLLCGAAGQHDMVYCNVCCEPFHTFCLDNERPQQGNLENWVCRRCQACHVCGRPRNLLECEKCQDHYHPACLGPNYPTRPSKQKGVWLCPKCVKCKSCGATTPGRSKDATWTHDFQLCHDCGKLMDQGNFCPVCHKCYAADDWESKMIQCATCDSWVHAKCEDITDELYHVLSGLPEDTDFHCRVCSPVTPSAWRGSVEQAMSSGFCDVMGAILSNKSSVLIEAYRDEDPLSLPSHSLRGASSRVKSVTAASDRTDSLSGRLQERTGQSQPSSKGVTPSSSASELLGLAAASSGPAEEEKDKVKKVLDFEASNKSDNPVGGSEKPSEDNQMDVFDSNQEPFIPGEGDESRLNQSMSSTTTSISPTTIRQFEEHGESMDTSDVDIEIPSSVDHMSAANDVFKAIMQQKGEPEPSVKTRHSAALLAKKEGRKDWPKDFRAIRRKVKDGSYTSVEVFCDDIVRIIQYNLSKEEEQRAFRRKAVTTVRSLFMKQMETSFPWFNANLSRLWEHNQNLPSGMLPNAVIPPYSDHTYAQWMTREEDKPVSPQPSPFKKLAGQLARPAIPPDDDSSSIAPSDFEQMGDDTRKCALCHKHGDQKPTDAGRLLYATQDEWVHVNCGLWSAEVYESAEGALQRVPAAIVRGRKLKCDHCSRSGATVGCCASGCSSNYHVMCARSRQCVFQDDKRVYCRQHQAWSDGERITGDRFAVMRRVCVQPDYSRTLKKMWQKGLDPRRINITIGSMTIERLGTLCQLSDCRDMLLPVDYCISRIYWSTVDARRRCVYTCRVIEVRPQEKSTDIVMKDLTVVHDPQHPDYNQDLVKVYTAPTACKTLLSHNATKPVHELSPSEDATAAKRPRLGTDDDSVYLAQASSDLVETESSLSQSWPSARTESEMLTQSFPPSGKSSVERPMDLTFLSPTTLKLLNKSDLSKYASPSASTSETVSHDKDVESELCLGQIVRRLNTAAANSKQGQRSRSSREGSVDSRSSQSREGSVDRQLLSPPADHQKRVLTLDNLPEEAVEAQSLNTSAPNTSHLSTTPTLSTVTAKGSALNPTYLAQQRPLATTSYMQKTGQAPRITLVNRSASTAVQQKSLLVQSRVSAPVTVQQRSLPGVARVSHSMVAPASVQQQTLATRSLASHSKVALSSVQPPAPSAPAEEEEDLSKVTFVIMSSKDQYEENHEDDSDSDIICLDGTWDNYASDVEVDHIAEVDDLAEISDLQNVSDLVEVDHIEEIDHIEEVDDVEEISDPQEDEDSQVVQLEQVRCTPSCLDPADDVKAFDSSSDDDENVADDTLYGDIDDSSADDTDNRDPESYLLCLDGQFDDKNGKGPRTLRSGRKVSVDSTSSGVVQEEGTFKCQKCKRFYRTKESCEKHAQVCNFEVSTSEEEEEDFSEDDEVVKDYPLRNRRLSSTSSTRSHGSKKDDAGSLSPPINIAQKPNMNPYVSLTRAPIMDSFQSSFAKFAGLVPDKGSQSKVQNTEASSSSSSKSNTPTHQVSKPPVHQAASKPQTNTPSTQKQSPFSNTNLKTYSRPHPSTAINKPHTSSAVNKQPSQNIASEDQINLSPEPSHQHTVVCRAPAVVVGGKPISAQTSMPTPTPTSSPAPTIARVVQSTAKSATPVYSINVGKAVQADKISMSATKLVVTTSIRTSTVTSRLVSGSKASSVVSSEAAGTSKLHTSYTSVSKPQPVSSSQVSRQSTMPTDPVASQVLNILKKELNAGPNRGLTQAVPNKVGRPLPHSSTIKSSLTGAAKVTSKVATSSAGPSPVVNITTSVTASTSTVRTIESKDKRSHPISKNSAGRQVKVVTVSPMNIEKLKGEQGTSYKTTTTFANILPKSTMNKSPPTGKELLKKSPKDQRVSPNTPIFGSRSTSTHGPVAQAVVQPIVQQASGILPTVQQIDNSAGLVQLQQQQAAANALMRSPPQAAYNIATTPMLHNTDLQILPTGAIAVQQQPQIIGSAGATVNYLGLGSPQGMTGTVLGRPSGDQIVTQLTHGGRIVTGLGQTVLTAPGNQLLTQAGSPPAQILTSPTIINQGLAGGTMIAGQQLIAQPQVQQQYLVSSQATNTILNSVPLGSMSVTNPIVTMAASGGLLQTISTQDPRLMGSLNQGYVAAASGVSIMGSGTLVSQPQYTTVYTQPYVTSATSSVMASAQQPQYVITSGASTRAVSTHQLPVPPPVRVVTSSAPSTSSPPTQTKQASPPKDTSKLKEELRAAAESQRGDSTVTDILKSLKTQIAQGNKRPKAEITVQKSDFVKDQAAMLPKKPVISPGEQSKKVAKMDLQSLCQQIKEQSESLVNEGKRVKISGEIDEHGVTRFRITASAAPLTGDKSNHIVKVDQTRAVPSRKYQEGMIQPTVVTAKPQPVPRTVSKPGQFTPVPRPTKCYQPKISQPEPLRPPHQPQQTTVVRVATPTTIPTTVPVVNQQSDRLLSNHLSMVKKALMVKKGLHTNIKKRRADEGQSASLQVKKFKTYQQRANELSSRTIPDDRLLTRKVPSSLLRPRLLSPEKRRVGRPTGGSVGRPTGTVGRPPGHMYQAGKRGHKQSRKENLSSTVRKDIPEVMRPHTLYHPKLHQHLPAVGVEEEIQESPLTATADDRQPPVTPPVRKDAPHLMYEVTSDDGFYACTDSLDKAWKAVTDQVQDARANARLKQISYASITGAGMFGLTHNNVTYLLEQLPGAKYCRNHRFKHFSYDDEAAYDSEPEENPSGSARTEVFEDRHPHDIFNFLMSKHRQRPPYTPQRKTPGLENLHKSQRRVTSSDLPIAMKFRHLREHAKEAVGVYRSRIHGRGLFCKRDIDSSEMIIEYAGEVIRSMLTDKREMYYEGKGIGCYMFRIDEDDVIDATLKGNAARFINHSCEPNCYSKVITVDFKKHIVIFAIRPIKKGEELTYDYKFPYEEVKIPCTCASRKCRKYLN